VPLCSRWCARRLSARLYTLSHSPHSYFSRPLLFGPVLLQIAKTEIFPKIFIFTRNLWE
jgi:hypothetical protein